MRCSLICFLRLGHNTNCQLLPTILLNFFLSLVLITAMAKAEESQDAVVNDNMVVKDVDLALRSVLSKSLDLSSCLAGLPAGGCQSLFVSGID